jgi:hypothetical protein
MDMALAAAEALAQAERGRDAAAVEATILALFEVMKWSSRFGRILYPEATQGYPPTNFDEPE